jgi:hypothetical protein
MIKKLGSNVAKRKIPALQAVTLLIKLPDYS